MLEYYFAGGGLRLFQTIIYASLWIVIGCFIAAIFRRMLGPEKVRNIFGNQTRFSLLAGWGIGMLLPVCSLGVIPIVRELHRCGVNRGTIVAFGLTAPLFNPLSVLYGLTLSDPIAILSFSLCALVIVSILGAAWNLLAIDKEPGKSQSGERVVNRIFGMFLFVSMRKLFGPSLRYIIAGFRFIWNRLPDDKHQTGESQTVQSGIKRIVAVFYSAGRELVGASMVYILIGIGFSVALATFLPHGHFQTQVERDNALAPIVVAIVATPVHSTPLLAMSQIGGMFQHGNSIGAAFSMLILGAGANIGLLVWFGKAFRFKRMVIFYLLLAGTTICLAYVIDKPLTPKGIDPAGHTHAFDVYTNPFQHGAKNVTKSAMRRGGEFWKKNEFGGTFLLGFLAIVGVASTLAARKFDMEAWFSHTQNVSDEKSFDRELPGWFLGLVSVCGLVAASILGCYVFYPPATELLEYDLSPVNTNLVVAARNGKWEAADRLITYADDLSRRLEVGVFLRNGSVGEYQTAQAKYYRETLDELKELVDSRSDHNLHEKAMEVSSAYLEMSKAFKDKE